MNAQNFCVSVQIRCEIWKHFSDLAFYTRCMKNIFTLPSAAQRTVLGRIRHER